MSNRKPKGSRAVYALRAILVIACCVGVGWLLLQLAGYEASNKARVTISVWDEELLNSNFSRAVEEMNPEVDIYWLMGADSEDFYAYQARNGSLPDVILVPGLNLRQPEGLMDSLYDLRGNELAQTFDSLPEPAIAANGDSLKWVAADSPYVGIVINQYLFKANKIKVPQTIDEFYTACKKLKKQGIKPITGNFADDMTLFSFAQTIASDFPASEAGKQWAQDYREGKESSLTEEAWDSVFAGIRYLASKGILNESVLKTNEKTATKDFLDGKAAMIFVTDENLVDYARDLNMTVRALPCFSSTGQWVGVQPSFYGAVSSVKSHGSTTADKNATARDAAANVLASIMSQEGQEAYFAVRGQTPSNILTLSSNDLPDAYELLKKPLSEGSLNAVISDTSLGEVVAYELRNAVAHTKQNVSKATKKKLAETVSENMTEDISKNNKSDTNQESTQNNPLNPTEPLDASEAAAKVNPSYESGDRVSAGVDIRIMDTISTFLGGLMAPADEVEAGTIEAVNLLLKEEKDAERYVVAAYPEGMSNIFDAQRGNMVVNAIGNVASAQLGCDGFVLSPYTGRCPIYRGEVTATELCYPVAPNPIEVVDLSGKELFELVSQEVEQASSDYELPVLSGFTMRVKRDEKGFVLEELKQVVESQSDTAATPAGQSEHAVVDTVDLDKKAQYRVGVTDFRGSSLLKSAAQLGGVYQEKNLQVVWCNRFSSEEDSSLLSASSYIEFS